jgi:hypothetical protein
MHKNRLAAFVIVFLLVLSASGYAQADTRGNIFLSTGWSRGFINDPLNLRPNFALNQITFLKLGAAWELPLGPGNASFGLETGYSSGSRFGGSGGVDFFPLIFSTTYGFPLGNIFYAGPSLKLGGFGKLDPDGISIIPLVGVRLELELRSLYFPLGLYVTGGVDALIPISYDAHLLPAVELGLRFPRGTLRRPEPLPAVNGDATQAAVDRQLRQETVHAPPAVVYVPPAATQVPPTVVQVPPAVTQVPPAVAQAPPAAVQVQQPIIGPPGAFVQALPPAQALVPTMDEIRQGLLYFLYFEPETMIPIEESRSILDSIGRQLLINPSIWIFLRSYAAPFAVEDEGRFHLGVSRVRSVRDYFIRNFGIAPSRIVLEAYSMEIAPKMTTDDWETERDAEIIVFER